MLAQVDSTTMSAVCRMPLCQMCFNGLAIRSVNNLVRLFASLQLWDGMLGKSISQVTWTRVNTAEQSSVVVGLTLQLPELCCTQCCALSDLCACVVVLEL